MCSRDFNLSFAASYNILTEGLPEKYGRLKSVPTNPILNVECMSKQPQSPTGTDA